MNNLFPKINMQVTKQSHKRLFLVVIGIMIGIAIVGFQVTPPSQFTPGTTVVIPEKSTTRQAGQLLVDAHIIRSRALFEFFVNVISEKKSVIAGEFSFEKEESLVQVVSRITEGFFGKAQVKLTIPEGSSHQDIARIVQKIIPEFNGDEFVAKAKSQEGYLFPETYFIFRTVTPDALIARLTKEYQSQTKTFEERLLQQKRTEEQIIIMASLLEKEAFNKDEAKIISGILWKRFNAGMPLQVDAPFLYTLGKTSEMLTRADLQKDGPYNTYTRKGLPIGPIGNPGIDMITAALEPVDSPYWYYLHDSKGNVYFGKTYQDHLQNKQKYLK